MSRVLLVDNNPADQRLFIRAVEANRPDCDVEAVADIDGAVAFLNAGGKADLVVLDAHFIGPAGAETVRRLRCAAQSPVPLIVFCESQIFAEIAEVHALGAMWFRMPFNVLKYFQVVGKILAFMKTE